MTPRSPRDILKQIDGAVSEMEADMYMAGMAESAENGTMGSPGKGNVADERLARTVAQERLMTLEDEFAELNMLTDQQAQQNNLCQERIAELEELIQEMQQAKVHSDREKLIQNARAAELEEEVGVARAMEEKNSQHHAFQSKKILGVEKMLLEAKDREADMEKQQVDMDKHRWAADERILVLEQDLASFGLAEADHVRRHEADRNRILDLEQSVLAVEQDKIRKLAEHVARIAEVDELLVDAKVKEQSQAAREQSHRATITELEGRLADTENAAERSKRQSKIANQQLVSNEAELEEVRLSAAAYSKQQQALRARELELEQELVDAEDKLKRQNKMMAQQLAALETELAEVRLNEGSQSQHHQEFRSRVNQLEKDLEESNLLGENHRRDAHTHNLKVLSLQEELNSIRQTAELHVSDKEGLRKRLATMDQEISMKDQSLDSLRDLEASLALSEIELERERKEKQRLREELNEMRIVSEKVTVDAQMAITAEGNMLERNKVEWELKMQQAQDKNRELEVRLQMEQEANMSLRSLTPPAEPRRSLSNVHAPEPRLSLTKLQQLGTSDTHPPEPRRSLSNILAPEPRLSLTKIPRLSLSQNVENVEGNSLSSSMHSASKISGSLNSPRRESPRLPEPPAMPHIEPFVPMSRGSFSGSNATSSTLLTRTSLRGQAEDEAARMVAGLGSTMPASEQTSGGLLAESLRRVSNGAMPSLSTGGISVAPSPLVDPAASLFQNASMRPSLTKPPGDIFVKPMNESLISGSTPRPDTNMLPPQYQQLLSQIEENGWASVTWKKDYTMLHWSASKGHSELCRYLVKLGGNPGLRDSHKRSPGDLARQGGHVEVGSFLDGLC